MLFDPHTSSVPPYVCLHLAGVPSSTQCQTMFTMEHLLVISVCVCVCVGVGVRWVCTYICFNSLNIGTDTYDYHQAIRS